MYGDPDELERLADRLRRAAHTVREHGADHVRAAAAARWVSTSADAFRVVVTADRVAADRAASEVERAAALLVAHAQEVRVRLAAIARFEEEVTGWFAREVRSLAGVAEGAAGAAGRVVAAVRGEPPWSGWPVGPHNLPPPGDRRWLDVGGFLRSKGVL